MTTASADSIDIVRYAEVMAYLRHFPPDKHAEVIARIGVRQRDWQAAAKKWQAVRDAERASGKLEVTVRYGRVLAATRAKLDGLRPPIESLGPYPGPDGLPPAALTSPRAPAPSPEVKPEGSVAPPIVQVPTSVVQVPTYVVEEQRAADQALAPLLARPPSVPRPPAGMASSEVLRLASGTIAAPVDAAPPSLPAGVPALTMEQYASLRVELETGPDHVPGTLARYGVSLEGREALDAHWKARFAADPTLRMTFAIRYANYVSWLKGGSRAPSGHASPAPVHGAPSPGKFAVTSAPSDSPAGPAMPFDRRSGSPGSERGEADRTTAASPAPSGVGTGTVAASEGDGGVPLPPGIPDLTIEQYASLRVELQQTPDRLPETLARYGVPAQRREALEAYWKARFARDAVLHMTFSRTYAQYVAWFKANRGATRT